MTDHDQLGKTFVKTFFKELLELFCPELAARLELDDPALPVTFLDKEVYTDFPTGDRRNMDVLGKVWTREREVEQILLHTETQEEDDPAGVDPRDIRALRTLMQKREKLPLSVRMFLYSLYLQQRHFPDPVVAIAMWFARGKGGIGIDRYDYRSFGAGLSIEYYRVCVPDLPAEEYLATDNPVAYGLAVRMKRGRLSPVELAYACRSRIVRSGLSPMKKALLWNYGQTYSRLTEAEEAEMQLIVDKPENRDIKESELTYFGRIAYQGRLEGRLEEARQTIESLCGALGLRLTPARRKHVESLDLQGLHALRDHLVHQRRWPK